MIAALRSDHRPPVGAAVIVVVLAVLTAGCSPPGTETAGSRDGNKASPASGQPSGDLVVFAAASLTEAFRELAEAFETAHPQVTVRLNLAGSQQLAGQLVEGAPGDVFASADLVQMRRVAGAGLLASPPEVFAGNELRIVVEDGNPHHIGGLADLARRELIVVFAAPHVPAGRYARAALDHAGVDVHADSLEVDVRQVVAKVALGEADAGVVYATDVAATDGEVDEVALPAAHQITARYAIAALSGSANTRAAKAFVRFVQTRGRSILAGHGFRRPPKPATAPFVGPSARGARISPEVW